MFPARVAALASEDDLALLRIERLRGSVPTVKGFGSATPGPEPGTAVALIGFPLGGAADLSNEPAAAIVSAGVVSSVSPGRFEVDGYGAEGASGSPFFNADGEVIGVLYGGSDAEGRRLLHGVTVDRLLRLLDGLAGG